MKKHKIETKCHTCGGSGIVFRMSAYSTETRELARKMYTKGYSLAEIARKIGVKHRQQVKSLISAKTL